MSIYCDDELVMLIANIKGCSVRKYVYSQESISLRASTYTAQLCFLLHIVERSGSVGRSLD